MSFKRQILLNAFRAADVAVMAIAFAVAMAASAQRMNIDFQDFLAVRIKFSNILLFVGFSVIWHLIFTSQGLYRSRRIGLIKVEWWDVTKAVVLGTLLLSAITLFFKLSAINRTFLATFFAVVLPATVIMRGSLRIVLGGVRQRGRNLRNAVIVGCGPRGTWIGRQLRNRRDLGYLLLGYIDDIPAPESPLHSGKEKLLGRLNDFNQILRSEKVDEVFIALPIKSFYETVAKLIKNSEELGVIVRIPAGLLGWHLVNSAIDYLDDDPFLTLQSGQENALSLVIKRLLDVLGSAVALIVHLPISCHHSHSHQARFAGPRVLCPGACWFNRRMFRATQISHHG